MPEPPVLLAEVKVDDLTIRVERITDGDGNHALQLVGVDCDLTGEMPGLYYPVPRAAPDKGAVCLCGHTSHWHNAIGAPMGAGECEHDGECRCKRFRPDRPDTRSDASLGMAEAAAEYRAAHLETRPSGLWVVLARGPGPDSDFVELEDGARPRSRAVLRDRVAGGRRSLAARPVPASGRRARTSGSTSRDSRDAAPEAR